MDNFTIYTLGGGDILFMVFNVIASLLRPEGGLLHQTLLTMGTIIGGTMAIWMTVFRHETQPMLKWFITYAILVTGFVSPVSKVDIKDSMLPGIRVVENVPFALAFGASIISSLGNGFTQVIEQVFQPSPTEMVGGIGLQGNLAPSYSKTGFIFGAEAIQNMKRVAFDNQDIEDNMHGFVNQCVTYDALIGRKYTMHDLKHSDDLWGLVSEKASQMRGFPWRDVVRDGTNKFVKSNGTEIITCKEGARRLNALWHGITHSSLDDLSKKIGINQAWSKDQNALSNQVKSHLPGAIDKLTNSAKGAADHIKQQLMISSILKGSEQKTIELGGSPNFEVRRAYLQQRETYQTIGHVIAQGLPSIKNVLEALLYCMFIFVMGLILLPNGVKLLGFYFKILLWLQLWAPLFAMLNFIMTEAMSWRAMSAMKGANGITIGNFVGLSNMAMDMSAIAGYLCSVIPILAWTLLERGGYAFVSMASNLMGVGTGAATQAATEKATGNYSFGNMSFENRNMNNMSQLKHDHAPIYSGHGHMMTNEGSSSMVTDADGHQILTRNESHLPVSLNMAEQQETMLRDTRRDAQSFAEGEQQSAMIAKQQANNHYLEIGKQAQHTLSSGTQFQDQETYSNMKEAADHYNRVEQISNKTGLSKEYVNQKALEGHVAISGGAEIGGDIGFVKGKLASDIGLRTSKSENKQMSASEAADSILELGKTTNFNDQHQKVHGFHKNKNVDIQDQELKQSLDNFSSSYETSNRHEQSAHKSFETVKSMDQEIAKTQSASGSINASYTQDFVDYVGAGNLRHMPVTQQQKEANQYMNQRILEQQNALRSQTIADKHQESMKDSYHKSQADGKYGGQTMMQENHKAFGEKIKADQPQVNRAETGSVMWRVNAKNQTGSERVMKAEEGSKQQQRSATNTFTKEHDQHAEDNMGMLKQVTLSTFKISLFMGLVTFISYYFYTNYWMNILMYPFWGLAECMNLMKLIFRHLQGFTYIVDIDYKMIVKCTPDYFLGSGYAQKLIAYLNYTLIQGAIYAVISMVITVFVSIIYFMRKGKKLKNTKQLSGIHVLDTAAFKKELKKQKVPTSLTLDKMPIPFEAETKHFMVSGTTGSGKSNMINHLLKAIEARGDKAVIVDTTGGFAEKFYQEGRDTILNPYDARTKDWCLWSEPLNHDYEFSDLAESLIEKQHNDVFWGNASRETVVELLKRLKKESLSLAYGLDVLLNQPLQSLHKFFKDTSVASHFDPRSEKVALSLRSTLCTQLKCLLSLQDIDDGFSVDDWIKGEHNSGFLFLSGLPKQRAALRPLWSVWFNMAVKSVMDLRPDSNRRIWFIVDELSSLNKLPCLDMALAEGRKYGACMVLGFQNMAQVQEIYGTRGTKSLSELMVNKFLFQAVDFDNALMLSRFFGERQILESHENVSFGANEIRDGVSLTHHKKTESIIRASDLMELKPLNFYSRIAGQNTCIKGDFTYFSNPSIAHAFLEKKDKGQAIQTQLQHIKKPETEEKQEGNVLDFPEASKKESKDNETEVMQPNELNKREEKVIDENRLLGSLDEPHEI